MTCIVALRRNDTVWLGGDSAGTMTNMMQVIRKDKKVFIRGEFLIGFCGSFRMGQLLRHTLVLPTQVEGQEDIVFMVNDFVDAVRKCLLEENAKAEARPEERLFPDFLVGYRGHIYNVSPDYQVGEPEDNFDAIGSGADLARGALHVMQSIHDPEERIIAALEASAHGNAAVRPPFTVLNLVRGERG